VTNLTAAFDEQANLHITWTNPVANNFKDAQIALYSDGLHTAYYGTCYNVNGALVWTAAENLQTTSGAGAEVVFVEVASRSYSNAVSAPVTASATMPRPNAPANTSTTWDAVIGSCLFIWDATPYATRYALVLDGISRDVFTNSYRYSLELNAHEHGGTPDPSLVWSLQAYNALNKPSTAVTGTTTLAPPSPPTLTSSDFTGIDALLDWTDGSPVATHRMTLDTIARYVSDSNYVYSYALNRQEHAGTPDPSIDYSVVGIDAFGQESTALTGTLVNPVPDAPAGVTVLPGTSSAMIDVSGTRPADFLVYAYRLIQNGSTVKSWRNPSPIDTEVFSTSGTFTVAVAIVDAFEQASAEVVSDPFTASVFDVTAFRAETTYTDDLNTNPLSLDVLKDGTAGSGGITYPAL
jgi:hypothetical protein